MKLNRVLVAFKRRVANISGRGRGWPRARQSVHGMALESVLSALEDLGIEYRAIDRNSLKRNFKADLIIAVGGDGTLIASAHAAGEAPVLGVNSMPGHSVGFFCAADARTFKGVMRRIISGKFSLKRLPLIEARIGERAIAHLALNDILFAGATPADMARYTIRTEGKSEEQKSSGIWISAGPGSTAATGSAGGARMPVTSDRLQFVVREPYPAKGARPKIRKGILRRGAAIAVIPETAGARIYIDGPKLTYRVPIGSELKVRVSKKRLRIFL